MEMGPETVVSLLSLFQVIPEVQISVLLFKESTILPHFLDRLERLTYPKDKIHLLIRCDRIHGDATCDIIDWWSKHSTSVKEYASLDFEITETDWKVSELSSYEWSDRRARLRQEALDICRQENRPWLFYLDGDVLFSELDIIQKMISALEDEPEVGIVAPLVRTSSGRTNVLVLPPDEGRYDEVIHDESEGLFDVELVEAAVLISMKHPQNSELSFDENSSLPLETLGAVPKEYIPFCFKASAVGMKIKCFREWHREGYRVMGPALIESEEQQVASEQFVKMQAVRRGPLFHLEEFEKAGFKETFPQPTPLPHIDKVFVINLKRRPEKRERMDYLLKLMGIEYTLIEAFDGQLLSKEDLQLLNVGLPPTGYYDGYRDFKRIGISAGATGLTLTSVALWSQIIQDESLNSVLVLEDDCHFTDADNFRDRFQRVMEELISYDPNWELLYLGRKMFEGFYGTSLTWPDSGENLEFLEKPGHSHWTVAMAISRSGVRKLLKGNPLRYLVPLDEYIPVMGGIHLDRELMELHPTSGSLNMYGLYRQLIWPMIFVFEPGYITDTLDDNDKNILPVSWFINSADVDGAVEFFVEEIPGVVQDSSLNQDRSSYKEYFAELAKFLESYLIPNNTTGNPVTSRGCESVSSVKEPEVEKEHKSDVCELDTSCVRIDVQEDVSEAIVSMLAGYVDAVF